MDTVPLTLFAQKVSASNRLLFADLRRLQRDILPGGITTQEEAEVLLGLDHIERLDDAWPAYLAEAVGAFVLSASKSPGLNPTTTEWLVTVLSAAQPRTAAAIVHTIESEGYQLTRIWPLSREGQGGLCQSRVRAVGDLIARSTVVRYLESNERH
jgi:hypothetical protein